jgi:PAS domain S-box-containing protein
MLIAVGALALAIFVVDAFTPLDMAVAVLYVVVVLVAGNVLDRRGLLLVAAGCLVLTVVAYFVGHGLTATTALGRCLMSVSAIGITAFLTLKNQAASTDLRERARLLDLTHDATFVRDMNDVILYWNRAAEELYGWRREQAVGKVSHELMRSSFPEPLAAITAKLVDADRWEGEVTHTKRDGTQVVVASRWSLQRDERGRPVAIMETNDDITARREAEQRIRKAERELRTTIDTIPALVLSAWPDGKVDFINARWVEQGFSEHDLRSGPRALVHPDDLPDFAAKWSRSLRTGEPYQAEVRLRQANGEYRWYLAQAVTLRDETRQVVKRYATATDIEDLKRAEDALRRSEALLAETQELTHTGTIVLNIETGELLWSAEAARIFGYDPSVTSTRELVLQRIHPDDLVQVRTAFERALMLGEVLPAHDFRLLMPDGAVKHVRTMSHGSGASPERPKVLRALIDMTAARGAEAALHEAHAELAHVTRVTALGELTTSIAHEVNQPLAGIVTNGQACLRWLTRDVPDLDEARGAVTRIVNDADRASEVILRIRALAQKGEPEKTRLNLNEAIDDVLVLMRREVHRHQVRLQLDLAPDLPPVLGDRVQLQQVIINLVINAIQAMASVTDRPRDLMIRSRPYETARVLVAVQDSGTGIGPDDEVRLFERFFTTKPDGIGIGLSICRSIVEAHGGEVWASSHSGPGATFQFALPSLRETAS